MPESLFNKVAGLRPGTLLKKTLWHTCFLANFEKFLRTTFLSEHLLEKTIISKIQQKIKVHLKGKKITRKKKVTK